MVIMGSILKFNSISVSDTERIGRLIAQHLVNSDFVAIYGDLGAGKTAFVRGMASFICPTAKVSSPTYSVINEYRNNDKVVMCHVDAYRINDDDDLYSTGFYDYLDNPAITIVVEWSEKIPFALPDDVVKITINRSENENSRVIIVENLENTDLETEL